MPVVKLDELADALIEKYSEKYDYSPYDINKKVMGPRVGEKIYEELMTETEAKMAYETDEMLIIPPQLVLPDLSFDVTDYKNARPSKLERYASKDTKPLTVKEINNLLNNIENNKDTLILTYFEY